MDRKALEERLAGLSVQAEHHRTAYMQVQGAIADVRFWLAKLDEAEKNGDEPRETVAEEPQT